MGVSRLDRNIKEVKWRFVCLWYLDGLYIPRVFFLSPDGNPMMDAKAVEGPSNYNYFYFTEEQILRSMNHVLSNLQG